MIGAHLHSTDTKNFFAKLFRDERLFKLIDRPLEEIAIPTSSMTQSDIQARQNLAAFIESKMQGVQEPALVDSHGKLIAVPR